MTWSARNRDPLIRDLLRKQLEAMYGNDMDEFDRIARLLKERRRELGQKE